MKAVMFYQPGEARIEDIPMPRPGPGELLVKIGAALTCGTDLKAYRRGHPTLFKTLPSPFGHEFAGTVVEVGAGVERFAPGQRVVAVNSAPCGSCYYCHIHRESLCERLELLNGAYAESIIIPARIVEKNTYLLPDHLSFAEAALLEPLACAVHGLDALPLALGDTVVVSGCGPIGLMFVNLAALRGARVIACGKGAERLAAARRFGACAVLDAASFATADDQVAAARALTPEGRGADIAIEAVGKPGVWEQTLRMARRAGTVLLFGGMPSGSTVPLDATLLHYGELTIMGVYHHTPRHVQIAFDLLCNGVIRAQDYISGSMPLAETIAALELIGSSQGIKYAIIPPEAEPPPFAPHILPTTKASGV